MKTTSYLIVLLFLSLAVQRMALGGERPNFLIILADDCTYNDLPMYGGQNARTPHLDALAREGLIFDRAYVSMAMCQPCRAELYTGQYPLRNGCAWNHSACRPGTRSLPQHLGALGYRVGLAGKVHVLPPEAFPFEVIAGFDTNCVRNPTQPHRLDEVREFITRRGCEKIGTGTLATADSPGFSPVPLGASPIFSQPRREDQPFCLVVSLVEPHVPWVMGDASKYPPRQLKLPPNIADTPRTRQDFARYLAEITYMDSQVGEILATLADAQAADKTLVLFSSEQGSQFPGCKWTNWDTGLHTALIARWPGKVPAGQRTAALVQYADVAPTLVELAGGNPSEPAFAFDGTSFAAVLRGQQTEHRRFAYGAHNNIPEGPAYPIRTVTDGQWRYIRNLTPDELYIEKHLMGIQGGGELNNPYWHTWVGTAWDNPDTYRLVKRYMSRPAEELYHTATDPYEMADLADDPGSAAIKARLSTELDRWLAEQNDPGVAQDTHEVHRAAKQGDHRYFPKAD